MTKFQKLIERIWIWKITDNLYDINDYDAPIGGISAESENCAPPSCKCAATPWNYDMSEAPLDTAIVVANTETWGRAFLYTRDRLWLMNGEWFTPDEFAETFIAWAAINLPEGDRG